MQGKEVTKEEFKHLYFQYGKSGLGWTQEYWDQFFEKQTVQRYFFEAPAEPAATRMMIESGQGRQRMYFLTEEAEESFYNSE